MIQAQQYRMRRLQVYNWGTFSDIHNIPIAEKGFLLVGRSGAGKSTLLDALAALLVPPRWIDFNAAAREADRSGRDRNIVTYVRGAWAEQKDSDSGVIATRYLRTETTWSALALSYENGRGEQVTLLQLFWLRGRANGVTDVKRQYCILERAFDLSELDDFSKTNFDVRKLKQVFPDAFIRDEFKPYCERFSRLLGIESEMALRLLHKTQSAKNLGDLNTFLRDFMLDKPETFASADQLVNEFGELNSAHQAVITARDQVNALVPAREKYQHLEDFYVQKNRVTELEQGLIPYREWLRIDLLKQAIADFLIKEQGLIGEHLAKQTVLHNQQALLHDLEQQHRDLGGSHIEQWEKEKQELALQRDERLRKRHQAQAACTSLAWFLPDNPHAFAELIGQARQELETWELRNNQIRAEQIQLAGQKREEETAFVQTCKEVEALRRQPSNIPADMLELRRDIAKALGIAETALPFVGELIEIKSEETVWSGAIERVLHGFALSLLVEEKHYAALVTHINHTDLGRRRLVYYRIGARSQELVKSLSAQSLILKLKIKECSCSEWLLAELRQRFDYTCVDTIANLRHADRALTREGQIKHNKTRHEKDDRTCVDDRRFWVLGFDNREKLALFEKQAQDLAEKIGQLDVQIQQLNEKDKQSGSRALHCQALINLQWQEIDPAPLLTRIAQIEQALKQEREGNQALQKINEKLQKQKQVVLNAEQDQNKVQVELQILQKEKTETEKKLLALQQDASLCPLTPKQKQGLDEHFSKLNRKISLDNLGDLAMKVLQKLHGDLEDLGVQINECGKKIEQGFAHFIRTWPVEADGLDANLASAPDFFEKLTRLETDGLPAYEHQFFELLQSQSNQNLAALAKYLENARKAIFERLELVNESLSQVPFNQYQDYRTFLSIEAADRQLVEVKEFKQTLQQLLYHALNEDREEAEARFVILRKLVESLSSQDPERKRWRESVLDVRQHVEFIAREMDAEGVEVEIYRSGAGKSGGQRQKLATTCLAAALRYQLGGQEHGLPLYAAVILDEAFDKADNEFTALAMNIFNNFGFQMIVATPLKSVMTLEPFIGGACFVDISDRRISGVLLIEYDTEKQKLKLPEQAQQELACEMA